MIRKVFIGLFAIFSLMQLLSACCDCEEYPNLPADWTGVRFWYGAFTVDSGRIITSSDTSLDFSDRNLVISWKPEIQLMAARIDLAAFCNRAYACKCDAVQTYEMRRNVTGISVRTLFPFDAEHPPGSEVTALFKVPKGAALVSAPLLLPDNLLSDDWFTAMYLDARPGQPGPQQFELTLKLSDGAAVRDTTELLRF